MLRLDRFLVFVSAFGVVFLFQNCQYSGISQLSIDAYEEESYFTFGTSQSGEMGTGLDRKTLKVNPDFQLASLYDNCTGQQTPVNLETIRSGDPEAPGTLLVGSTPYFRMNNPAVRFDSCNMPLIDFSCAPLAEDLTPLFHILIYNFDESLSQAEMIMKVTLPPGEDPENPLTAVVQLSLFLRQNSEGMTLSGEPNGAGNSDIITIDSANLALSKTADSFEMHFVGPFPGPEDPKGDVAFECMRPLQL